MLRCLLALLPTLAIAAVGPETTLLAINGASPASLAVGNAWMAQRHIPFDHVVVLTAVPPGDHCTRSEFIAGVLQPLRAAVRERKLGGEISLVAFAPDFPLAIHMGLKDVTRDTGTWGALTGMTALGSLVLAGEEDWVEPSANHLYQKPPGLVDQPKVPKELRPEFKAVADAFEAKDYATGCAKLLKLDQQVPHHAGLLYDLACAHARLHHDPEALAALTASVAAGFTDWKWMGKDEDLAMLRERPEFVALVAKLRAEKFIPPPTTALSGSPRWLGDATPAKDDHDVLPAMLLGVTSGDGLGIEATIANLARAVAADGSHPAGTIFCVRNDDVRSTARQWAFEPLCDALHQEGIAAVLADGVLPYDAPAVAGAVVGSAGFAWKDSGSTILPGAICEHLTSFGAQLWPGAGQTHLTEWLRSGAAGTSGTVDEPLALQSKFPSPFIHLHYVRGLSLIEAFYRSVAGPYQLLMVGEPLCAPWAKPVAIHDGDAQHAPSGEQIASVELWLDGHRRATVAPGAALPAWGRLSSGTHELRLVCLPRDPAQQPARLSRPITGDRDPTSLLTAVPSAALGDALRFTVEYAGAARLRLRSISGVVAEAAGPRATLDCPTARLGLGPATLRGEALAADGSVIAQQDASITIAPPARLSALGKPDGAQPGPLVTGARQSATPTAACEGPAWLKESGLGEQAGSVTAWFQQPADGLWQAQWLGTRVCAVTIDDQPAVPVTSERWLLRNLAKGWHHVTFTIAAGPGPCGLRSGSNGTWPLDAKNCVHPAIVAPP